MLVIHHKYSRWRLRLNRLSARRRTDIDAIEERFETKGGESSREPGPDAYSLAAALELLLAESQWQMHGARSECHSGELLFRTSRLLVDAMPLVSRSGVALDVHLPRRSGRAHHWTGGQPRKFSHQRYLRQE